MKNIKIKETYLLFLIVIGLVSLSIYSTYALFTASTEIEDVVNFTATLTTDNNILEYEMITIHAGETKKIELNITNSYNDLLYYGAWYEMVSPSEINEDIKIGLYNNSVSGSGTIPAGETLNLAIAITNGSDSDIMVNIGVASSTTQELNLSENRTLILEKWSGAGVLTAAEFLMDETNIEGYEWNADITNYGLYATNSYTAEDGTTKYHDYRYVGAEPNNYVWFNNDMYRIIGVFDENSHGVPGQYLVKLIAANPLMSNNVGIYNSSATSGTYAGYRNDWSGTKSPVKSSGNVLLNHFFLEDSTNNYGTCGDWTNFALGTLYRTYNCSNVIGYRIKENSGLQDYIENVTWFLKGYVSTEYSKQNFYLCERGMIEDTTICNNGGTSGEYDASTQAKIGLMYASDYLYASGYVASSDSETTAKSYYHSTKNWLFKGNEWTIMPAATTNTKKFYINSQGLGFGNTSISYQLRPTFYLKSNIKISGGKGTFSEPYILST